MKPTRLGLNKGLVVSAAWGHRFKRAPRRSPRVAEGWKNLRAFIRRLPVFRFAAGGLAGGVGPPVPCLMRACGLGVCLPEIAVNFVVGRIPGAIESFFIRTLGEGAKLLALLTALAVFLVLPGIYAILYRRVQRWLKNRWLVMAFYTFSSAGIVLLAILPILDAGFLGSNTSVSIGFAVFSQLIGYWLYAALLDYLLVDVAAEHPEGSSLSRRQFIAGTIGALAVAALTVYGLGSLLSKKRRLGFTSLAEKLWKKQTPTSEFYVVTKNVIDPTVDAGTWHLSIGGLVSNPTTYSYADLQALATIDEFVTLECVSNEVGGNLISMAEWTGVRLATILQSPGPDPRPGWIGFPWAGRHTPASPVAKAMDPNTLVAIYM